MLKSKVGMKSGILIASIASMLVQAPAFASRSLFFPNTSSDFPFTANIQRNLQLKDGDGKPITLTKDGLLLKAGESESALKPDEIEARKVRYLDIDYDQSAGRSFLRLRTEKANLFGGAREVHFLLPNKIEIDGDGHPVGIENIQSSAAQTGQGMSLNIALTNPGQWQHSEYDGPQACTITHTRERCDWDEGHDWHDHHDHGRTRCHIETFYIPGTQNVHTTEDQKTDEYTAAVGSAMSIDFSVYYDNKTSIPGPCYPN